MNKKQILFTPVLNKSTGSQVKDLTATEAVWKDQREGMGPMSPYKTYMNPIKNPRKSSVQGQSSQKELSVPKSELLTKNINNRSNQLSASYFLNNDSKKKVHQESV